MYLVCGPVGDRSNLRRDSGMQGFRFLMLFCFFPLSCLQAQVFFSPRPIGPQSTPQKMKKVLSSQKGSPTTKPSKDKVLSLNFKQPVDRVPASPADTLLINPHLDPSSRASSVDSGKCEPAAGCKLDEPSISWSQMELLVVLGSWSESAQSDFSLRAKKSGGTSALARARVWWNEHWAVGMGLQGSWLADQSLSSGSRISIQQEALQWSLAHRTSVRYGSWIREIGFREWKIVPSRLDAQSTSLVSSGLYLASEIQMPFSNPAWSQSFGVRLFPVLQHRENPMVSGTHSRSVAWSAESRWGFQIDPRRSTFLRLEWESERNQFSGSSTSIDPQLGSSFESVSVQRNTWSLGFGFEWKK
jgi:hypothetical protein